MMPSKRRFYLIERIRLLLFFLILLSGGFHGVYSQCTLTVQDVNYCNTNSAVLGVGMQLTLASVPITNTITDFSWTGPNGFTSNSQYPIVPSPVVPGNYTLTVQAPGCVSNASDNTINAPFNFVNAKSSTLKEN